MSGKEKRFQKHINHEISRQLVNNAVTDKQAIAIEDLTGIRERTNKKLWNAVARLSSAVQRQNGARPRSRKDKRLGNNWAFYQLRQFLTYKCVLAGVKLILVNPAWTSQTCYKCHVIGDRKGKKFSCNLVIFNSKAGLFGRLRRITLRMIIILKVNITQQCLVFIYNFVYISVHQHFTRVDMGGNDCN